MDIKIKYDGEYPILCSGTLTVIVDGTSYLFPNRCLESGGSVSFDDDWNEDVTTGEWSISKWPENFSEELKWDVLRAINEQIDHGCCGGCV